MTKLTLAEANTIIAKAFEKGRELGLKPLSVVVLDAGGHVMAFQRQDGSSNLRLQIAVGKASGALSLGVSSRRIGEMAEQRPSFIAAVAAVAPNGILPAAGGLLIAGKSGDTIGAVGITGDTSDNDEACALYALEATGFSAVN